MDLSRRRHRSTRVRGLRSKQGITGASQTQQSRPKAALRRLPSALRAEFAYERTIPVAVAAKVVGVEMVDFTESPPFEIDGTSASHDIGRR
jgi:hypothetical protein